MDSLDLIKKSLKQKDEKTCIENLKILFLKNKENFTNTLLKSNVVPEPISYKTKDIDILFFNKVLTKLSLELLEEVDVTSDDVNIIIKFIAAINVIYKGAKLNSILLEKNEFNSMTSYAEKIKIPLVYLQYNSYMATKEKMKSLNEGFITNFESEIKNKKAEKYGNVKVSLSDSYEMEVEIVDLLAKFLYFKHKDEKIDPADYQNIKINPFYKPWFEMLQYISRDRRMLERLWNYYKYDKWDYYKIQKNNMNIHYFQPKSKDDFKLRHIGIKRRIYKETQSFHFQEDVRRKQVIKAYDKVRKNIRVISNIDKIFSLNPDVIKEIVIFVERIVDKLCDNIDDIYIQLKKDSFSSKEYIKGYTYLFTMASIYENLIIMFDKIDVESSQYYITELSLEVLATQFSRIYPDINKKKATEILSSFIFNGNNGEDIFMYPLIKMYDNVVFTPVLISRFVLERALHSHISKNNFDVSKKGYDFENNLKLLLRFNENIKIINQRELKFQAFDNREVEFDLLFTFEDHLVMIEMKNTTIPYETKEYYDVKSGIIKEAIEQIERRKNILCNDWDKIREQSSIELRSTPYSNDKIIKIVCTNIFDFSGNYENDIYFTDDSVLLKFFLDPYERFVELKDGLIVSNVKEKSIFEGKALSSKDFIDYLKNPHSIKVFDNCWEEQKISVCGLDKNEEILCYDLGLIQDPYAKKIRENMNI